MHLATTDAANELLDADPLALLLGMMLDQQVTMEKAFTSPAVLAERMGVTRLDAAQIAAADPAQVEEWFRTPPALHRYPGSMAQRAQSLCALLVDRYGGEAAAVWDTNDAGELFRRLRELPGFGEAKARIFLALLGKQRGITPAGWQEAAGEYGLPGFRSVADIVDSESLAKVRAHKQQVKAEAKAAKATKPATTSPDAKTAKGTTSTRTTAQGTTATRTPAKRATRTTTQDAKGTTTKADTSPKTPPAPGERRG